MYQLSLKIKVSELSCNTNFYIYHQPYRASSTICNMTTTPILREIAMHKTMSQTLKLCQTLQMEHELI